MLTASSLRGKIRYAPLPYNKRFIVFLNRKNEEETSFQKYIELPPRQIPLFPSSSISLNFVDSKETISDRKLANYIQKPTKPYIFSDQRQQIKE